MQTLLTEAVRVATRNADATARTGQLQLAEAILHAATTKTHMAGVAPTGTGKSLACLSVAAHLAATKNQRTLISTSGKMLQAQYVNKDLPVIVEATRNIHNKDVTYAILKGRNNYVDPLRLLETLQDLTGQDSDNLYDLATHAQNMLNSGHHIKPLNDNPNIRWETVTKLAIWGAHQYVIDDEYKTGDRETCPLLFNEAEWALVTASGEEAAGEDDTDYYPKGLLARNIAANAHIVVTNDTLLGIQAAKSAPVIIDNETLGRFDNIFVDEAHKLPAEVRSRGQEKLTKHQPWTVYRAITNLIEFSPNEQRQRRERIETLANIIGQAFEYKFEQNFDNTTKTAPIKEDDTVFNEAVEKQLNDFTTEYKKLAAQFSDSPIASIKAKYRRAANMINAFTTATKMLTRDPGGMARWLEKDPQSGEIIACLSPVEVGGLIRDNLWTQTAYVEPKQDNETWDAYKARKEAAKLFPREPLGVATFSATLPNNYSYEAGLACKQIEVESPFKAAYAASALYIPDQFTSEEHAQLVDRYGKLDTYNKHADFVTKQAIQLIEANTGRGTLILAANVTNGKKYVTDLRQRLDGIRVYSQWDDGSTEQTLQAWKDDTTSVLVGTKTFMTGVDNPQESCALVIIDRPARAAGNAVDEARVQTVMRRREVTEFVARSEVYVEDAVILLDQPVGRLIRSLQCRGVIAILDPRLLPRGVKQFKGSEPDQRRYSRPLTKFSTRYGHIRDVTEWLHATAPQPAGR